MVTQLGIRGVGINRNFTLLSPCMNGPYIFLFKFHKHWRNRRGNSHTSKGPISDRSKTLRNHYAMYVFHNLFKSLNLNVSFTVLTTMTMNSISS
jgi:hypothetical protein